MLDISSQRPVLWKTLSCAGGRELMGWLCPYPSSPPSPPWLPPGCGCGRNFHPGVTEMKGFGRLAAEPLSSWAWGRFALSLWQMAQGCPFHNPFSFREKILCAGSGCCVAVAAAPTCMVSLSHVLWAEKHREAIRAVTSIETQRLSTS